MVSKMSSPPLVVADHFPRVEKPCIKVAKVFFDCFTDAGKTTGPEVRDLRGPYRYDTGSSSIASLVVRVF